MGAVVENVNDVAAAIIDELGEVDAMALEKLLYYAQSWNLAISNAPLFNDEIRAWRNGPVVPSIYAQHKQQQTVCEWRSGSSESIAPKTANLIRLIGAQYGHLNGYQLSQLTHKEGPWKEVRGDLPENASSNRLIPQIAMADFYRKNSKLVGWNALEIALAGVLDSDAEGEEAFRETPADTPVYGSGQTVLSPDQIQDVRSRRRSRTSV